METTVADIRESVANFARLNEEAQNRTATNIAMLSETVRKFVEEGVKVREEGVKDRKDMKSYINEIKSNSNDIRKYTKSIVKYISGESKIAEELANTYMTSYFKNDPLFRNTFIYQDNEWKYLQKNVVTTSRYKNADQITEFDGLYIFSPHDILTELETDLKMIRRGKNTLQNSNALSKIVSRPTFVIVEAKHVIDIDEIKDKISKYIAFQEYVFNCKNEAYLEDKTIEFKDKVRKYKLYNFDTRLLVYFAGQNMSESTIAYILDSSEKWIAKYNIYVSLLKKSGDGFIVHDILNAYTENRTKYGQTRGKSVSTSKITFSSDGGKRKR